MMGPRAAVQGSLAFESNHFKSEANKEKDRRKLECNARICKSTSILGHINVVRVVPRCVVKRQFGDRTTDYVQLTNVGHAHARLSEHMSALPRVDRQWLPQRMRAQRWQA
jgi:hypothetical protein